MGWSVLDVGLVFVGGATVTHFPLVININKLTNSRHFLQDGRLFFGVTCECDNFQCDRDSAGRTCGGI